MANVKLVQRLRHILLLVFKVVTSKNLSNHSCKNLAMFIEELISYYNIYIKLVFHGSEMEFIEEAIVSCLWILKWVVPEKIHTPPTEEISAVRRGRGDKIVSDNSKCIRTSEGGRGVNLQFPP